MSEVRAGVHVKREVYSWGEKEVSIDNKKGVVSGKKVAEVYGHPRFSQFAPRISIRGAALAVHL